MDAVDLIKSLSLSRVKFYDFNFKVVTLYKNQGPEKFMIDNFGKGKFCSRDLKPLTGLRFKNFLAVYGDKFISSPDNISELSPDYMYEIASSNKTVLLYIID